MINIPHEHCQTEVCREGYREDMMAHCHMIHNHPAGKRERERG